MNVSIWKSLAICNFHPWIKPRGKNPLKQMSSSSFFIPVLGDKVFVSTMKLAIERLSIFE